jgi:hypothetical protein
MDVLLAVPGTVMVLLVALDIGLTVLHPTVRGPLSLWLTRIVWRVLRHAAPSLVGPVALGLTFAVWVGGLWVGFALIYLPFEEGLRGAAGAWGILDALYFSGESLTTVGFGDLAATSEVLRLVSVLEAACGLAAITAAITYLLSLFSVLSELRVAAARTSDLGAGEVRWAASLAMHGGPGEVRALQRDVIAAEEHLRRFPVLFFFDPKEHNYAAALLEAGALVCAVLRWGVRADRLPYAADYGRGLERSLDRVMDAISADFVRGASEVAPLDVAAAEHRLARMRAAVMELDPSLARDERPDDEARRFLARVDHFLAELAAVHGTETRKVLG